MLCLSTRIRQTRRSLAQMKICQQQQQQQCRGYPSHVKARWADIPQHDEDSQLSGVPPTCSDDIASAGAPVDT